MDASFKPILKTFERLADTYGHIQGLEAVNRQLLGPFLAKVTGRILEVGCGPGEFIREYFRPARQTLYAVDFSANMLAGARQAVGEVFGAHAFLVHGFAGALPFRDNTFHAVACVNTLHNLPSWDHVAATLGEMARVLRPGGLLLVECRNAANAERRRITRLHDKPSLPQKSYSFNDFRTAVASLGLMLQHRVALYGNCPDARWLSLKERPRAVTLPPDTERHRASPRFALLAVKTPPFQDVLAASLEPRENTT